MNPQQQSYDVRIHLDTPATAGACIRVIGVGGGGSNAVNSMIRRGLAGVDFIVANTDAQALAASPAPTKIQLGRQLTRGLGAGADPTIGQRAVEESIEEVRQALAGSDMIFVTAGMGGGTGTGAAPIIAQIGRELGALVVGIVTKPFHWEARRRMQVALEGIELLRRQVDALIVIPNQRLMDIIERSTTFIEAFQKVDDVLYNATRGIADIISGNGYVNVDFADVRTIMKNKGDAIMGIGTATGEYRAREAAINAINSPLLDGISIAGAEGVLINITAREDVSMAEIGEAVQTIEEAAGEQANLIFGVVFNPEMGDSIMVTVVATGFNHHAASTTPATTIPLVTLQKTTEPPREEEQHRLVANGEITSTYSVERHIPDAAPIGHAETAKYNEPAYLRRGSTISQVPLGQEKAKTEGDKPAFLRRIMD
ncbi:MAG: cell division protein FtsZ [Bacteroidota bacterium]|nr:cell division protein FtsZ [Candidatus Kapabacteria bacterium]MCS7302393.1 cell division protein FtsZ [Candidatus Kapabacteria bacterium]MCX7937133.1 cell division protein FtsZ [Chlorobiota bacterium]MDW8074626.1 cell division protein FtsZ [Bacteroidota bacterium]MDW8270898.1 cell division protein FtsZ [Bacteroidota bacterium]